ncbi:MAG: DUF5658 family protein [Stellaceae bacterium]
MAYLSFPNKHRRSPSPAATESQSKPGRGVALSIRASRLLLLILLIGLQIADVVTTDYALRVPGIWEANPLMALAQAKLGAVWWLPKLTVTAYLCAMAAAMRPCWPVIVVISFSGLVVLGNLTQLWLSDARLLLG